MPPPFTVEFIEGLNARFEHEEAPEILRWALAYLRHDGALPFPHALTRPERVVRS